MSIGDDLLNQIKIKIDSKLFSFQVKEEIYNPVFQKILKEAKRNNSEIYCQCNNVKMQIKNLKDKFYISSYPNRKKQHSEFCSFSEKADNFYTRENNQFILENLNLFLASNSNSKIRTGLNRENRKYTQFSGLILNILDSAYSQAFNIKNKGKDRLSKNLKNPEFELFLKTFVKNFINLKLKSGYDFYKNFKEKGLSFKTGKVYKVGDNFIKTKTFFKGEFITENVKIKEEILKNSLKNVQIFDKFISPPYFFFLVKKKRTVQKLFLYPVVDSKYFLPVESEFEREKIKKFSEKYCVYKPVLINSINSVLTKKYSLIYNKSNSVIPRPDLFVFTGEEIVIVEIFGMDNDKYLERAKEKEEFYKNLEKPFRYGKLVKR